MKKIYIFLLVIFCFCGVAFSAAGETYVSCSIETVIRMPDMISEPMEIKRYFYLNNAAKKVYDKSHKTVVSECENGIYTIHLRAEDRTERLIYNPKKKTVVLYGKQRRGYYYPWIGYNGQGNCTAVLKK